MDILPRNPVILALQIIIIGGSLGIDLVAILKLGPHAAALYRINPLALALLGLLALGDALLDAGDALDLVEELIQAALGGDMHIPVRVAQEAQQAAKEVGKVCDKLQVRDGVEQDDPANQKSPREGVEGKDTVPEQGDEALQGKSSGQLDRLVGAILVVLLIRRRLLQYGDVRCGGFRDDILDQAIKQLGSVFDGQFRVGAELTDPGDQVR